jgi:hypothetical protein
MKPLSLCLSLCLAGCGAFFTSGNTHANGPGGLGFGGINPAFAPFGFYQPYGAQYGTSLRTPPYFALNPPVYYGTRYARPYGVSPFASPPLVQAPAGYQAQVSPAFVRPPVNNPYFTDTCGGGCAKAAASASANELVEVKDAPHDDKVERSEIKMGKLQFNRFVTEAAKVARR